VKCHAGNSGNVNLEKQQEQKNLSDKPKQELQLTLDTALDEIT